jgi:hypothetical protein
MPLEVEIKLSRQEARDAMRAAQAATLRQSQHDETKALLGKIGEANKSGADEKAVRQLRRGLAESLGEGGTVLYDGAVPMHVVGLDIWRHDVEVKYRAFKTPTGGGGKRKPISELTCKARGRMRHNAVNSDTTADGMLVLTYPEEWPLDGKETKRHLDNFFRDMRRKFGDAFAWFWFMEFQLRGAPHIHVLTSGPVHGSFKQKVVHVRGCNKRCGVTLANPLGNMRKKASDSHDRCRVVYKGDAPDWVAWHWLAAIDATRDSAACAFNLGGIWSPIHSPDGARAYVGKEADKTWQKEVPSDFQNVGRFWGKSRNWKKPVLRKAIICREDGVREILGVQDDARLLPKQYGKAQTIRHNNTKNK